jgi:hypothetical protein
MVIAKPLQVKKKVNLPGNGTDTHLIIHSWCGLSAVSQKPLPEEIETCHGHPTCNRLYRSEQTG